MLSPFLLGGSCRPELYICSRCAFRASKVSPKTTKRSLGQKYLAKLALAESQWQEKAREIQNGNKKSMLRILEERGLVHKVTGDLKDFDDLLINKRIGAYVGIDPTASSLHVGHMLPLMSLFWMYIHGFHTVSLLGGATAKIGDPTGRTTSREKVKANIRTANMVAMHYQLKKLWINVEAYGRKYGYNWEWAWHRELVNNNTWMNKLTIMEVLQILGPGVRIGTMLGRETVKNKLYKGDGMSFSEFTYPLLQSWDWWYMYNTKGIQMQIGGSDQFGNITAGIDAVQHIFHNHPHPDTRLGREDDFDTLNRPVGLTVPLLTTSSGEKFGKSAGNAIWLDKEQTSTFDLYGFFIRQSDADVGRYLRLFTFLPIEDIERTMEEHLRAPEQRKAQHLLAREFVELVHGAEEAKDAELRHRFLFSKPGAETTTTTTTTTITTVAGAEEKTQEKPTHTTLNNAPKAQIKLPVSLIYNKSIGRIVYAAGLVESSNEGHRSIAAGSIYIGAIPGQKGAMSDALLSFTPVKNWVKQDSHKFLIDGKLMILRKGKHNVRIVEIVTDEEWKQSGVKYPGEEHDEIRAQQRQLTRESLAKRKAESPPPGPQIRRV